MDDAEANHKLTAESVPALCVLLQFISNDTFESRSRVRAEVLFSKLKCSMYRGKSIIHHLAQHIAAKNCDIDIHSYYIE